MKKKLPVFIFTLLAFCLTVSFFSFAAERSDGNVYCYLTEYDARISSEWVHFTSETITQFNGVWHFPHNESLNCTHVIPKFTLLKSDFISHIEFDLVILSTTNMYDVFSSGFHDCSIVNINSSYSEPETLRISSVPFTKHYSFYINKQSSDFYLAFEVSWGTGAINDLSFRFDNFIVDGLEVKIINQNDEIISKLTDQNEKLDHLNDNVDTVVDVLEDDSANVDMGTESFINKIDDLNADVGSFMSGHNFNINSVPANTLSEVGKIGSLASSVISCINLTNNPYLQATGRTNYVKSELGWYWSILVFTSAFCLVACLLARKGRALSPDAAEHHIESESSDESTYTREKWNPRTKSWSNIGTYRTRSTSNHSSRSSRK